jgi:hypothetical protein
LTARSVGVDIIEGEARQGFSVAFVDGQLTARGLVQRETIEVSSSWWCSVQGPGSGTQPSCVDTPRARVSVIASPRGGGMNLFGPTMVGAIRRLDPRAGS